MRYKWILKFKLIILSLLLSSTLGGWCDGDGDNGEFQADSTGCGVGAGDYEFELVNTLPESFNCNDSGRFVITISPKINTSYSGTDVFNRLYFILDSGIDIYPSNYVEFLTGNTADQQLEWGGSVPSDSYLVCATMKNIQLNSSCDESTYRIVEKELGWIHITEYLNPQKIMMIEYFCQYSDIGDIDRYDVFLSPNTEEYIDIAFKVANTTYNLIPYGLFLEPTLVEYTEQGIKEYIRDNKNWGWNMFLCGIKGFKDSLGYLLPDRLGVTYEDDSVTRAPSESTGSLIAVKSCVDYAASDEYRMDYNDLVTAMTIHELGLQRGAAWDEHESTWPYPKFCIAHEALILWLARARAHPYWTTRYSNPHFCDQCIAGIRNIGW